MPLPELVRRLHMVAPLAAVAFNAILLYVVLRQENRRPVHRLFALLLGGMLIWNFGVFQMRSSPTAEAALLWDRVAAMSGAFFSVLFYQFNVAFARGRPPRGMIPVGYLLGLVLAILTVWTPLMIERMEPSFWAYTPVMGPLFPFVVLYIYGFYVLGSLRLVRGLRTAQSAAERNGIYYVLLAMSVLFIGALFDLLPVVGVGTYPGGIVANMVFVVLVAIAIFRFRLFDVGLVVRKGMVYGLTTGGLILAYVLAVVATAWLFGSIAEQSPVLLAAVPAAAVGILAIPLRDRAQRWIERRFFRERFNTLLLFEEMGHWLRGPIVPDELAHWIVTQVSEAFHLEGGALLFRSESGSFVTRAAIADGGESSDLTLRPDHPVVRWLRREKRPLVPQTIEVAPQFRGLWLEELEGLGKLETDLFVPLFTGDRLVGVFMAGPKRSGEPFSLEDEALLSSLLNQLAVGVENLRLADESGHRLSQLRAIQEVSLQLKSTLDLSEVLDSVARNALQLADASDAHIFLWDEFRKELRFAASAWAPGVEERTFTEPRPEGLTHTVVSSGAPIFVDDPVAHPLFQDEVAKRWKLAAIAGIPLKGAGRVLGAINLAYREPHSFTEDEVAALNLLADQAAIAIENAQLYEEARLKGEKLGALRQIGLQVTAQLDLSEVLDTTLRQATELLRASGGDVSLLSPSGKELQVVAALGTLEPFRDVRLALGEGLAGRVARSGQPLSIDDYWAWEGRSKKAPFDESVRSVLAVPMKWQERVRGVLLVSGDREREPFDQDDLWLLELLAPQAAIAIENARLYSETKDSAQVLEEQVEDRTRAIRRSKELLTALNAAAVAVERVIEPAQVFPVVVEQLRESGIGAVVAEVQENGTEVAFTHLGFEPKLVRSLLEMAGLDEPTVRTRIADVPVYREIRKAGGGEASYREDGSEVLEALLPGPAKKLAETIVSRLAMNRAISAPVIVGDEVAAFLTLASPGISEADVPAVAAFANQVSIAYEKAKLLADLETAYEELQTTHGQLIHAEKLATAGRLAAGVAHEINNPLAGIINYLYIMRREMKEESPHRRHVEVIERQVDRIANIVRQLQDFSRPPQEERQWVEVNTLLEEVLSFYGKELTDNRVRVVRDLDEEVPEVWVPKGQLEQVFLNLVINAQEAMQPAGGELTVRTVGKNEHVVVAVQDTGRGIDPEHMDRLFEPFFTTKRDGSGLGLAISYGIVKDQGGEIRVESQLGKGTEFRVELRAGNGAGKNRQRPR
ncbi:MAG: GAF domain-containing protein [Anaerolineae bacterium]